MKYVYPDIMQFFASLNLYAMTGSQGNVQQILFHESSLSRICLNNHVIPGKTEKELFQHWVGMRFNFIGTAGLN